MSKVELLQGDCLEKMKDMPDESVDAVITDPPAGISFMGKDWDKDKGGRDQWIAWLQEIMEECNRVLKPGAHVIVWALPRTSHWTAMAIEDANFEIRDIINHVFNTGFPKSQDIAKAYDKRNGTSAKQAKEFAKYIKRQRLANNITLSEADEVVCGGTTNYSWFEGRSAGQRLPRKADYLKMKELIKLDNRYDNFMEEAEREYLGQSDELFGRKSGIGNNTKGHYTVGGTKAEAYKVTKGNSQWEGMGTNLKPATEHWILARKPLSEKTIVENCIKHGTGALDIDSCRIPTTNKDAKAMERCNSKDSGRFKVQTEGANILRQTTSKPLDTTQGRWPPNLLVTGDALNDGEMTKSGGGYTENAPDSANVYGKYGVKGTIKPTDSGSKSRFFDLDVWAEKHGIIQCPKASKKERNAGCEGLKGKNIDYGERKGQNNSPIRPDGSVRKPNISTNDHPTCKPVHLMSWLVRLVSKEGDTVLDPFAGSGTTGVACKKLGRDFIGIEQNPEYFKIAEKRIKETGLLGLL